MDCQVVQAADASLGVTHTAWVAPVGVVTPATGLEDAAGIPIDFTIATQLYHCLGEYCLQIGDIAQAMKQRSPQMDQAVAAFVQDVYDRGLSENILLVMEQCEMTMVFTESQVE